MNQLLRFLLFLTLVSCNKKANEEIALSKDSDTIFWKKRVTERKNKLISIQDVEKSEGEIFRFSAKYLIVETNCSKSNCLGKIIFFAQKMEDEFGPKIENEIFKKEFKLTKDQIKKIKTLISNSKIHDLPSDAFIKGWNKKGFDGITYIFETKIDNKYTFKHYWTPDIQKNLLEAQQVKSFLNDFFKIIDIDKLETEFRKDIPFKYYSTNF